MSKVPVVITFAPLGPHGPADPRPGVIRHARLSLTWQVVELLETWTHPHYLNVTFPEPAERRRYRLKVRGPLPWRPGERGEFAVVLRLYGDRRGWWMTTA